MVDTIPALFWVDFSQQPLVRLFYEPCKAMLPELFTVCADYSASSRQKKGEHHADEA